MFVFALLNFSQNNVATCWTYIDIYITSAPVMLCDGSIT